MIGTKKRYWPERLPRGAGGWSMWGIGLLLIGVYVVQSGVTAQASLALFNAFGLSAGGIEHGRLWQLITYSVIHGSWVHVLINALMLGMLGRKLSWMIGAGQTLMIGLAGILVGGLLHLGVMAALDSSVILVGASGALFAFLFALLGLSPGSKMWPLPLSGKSLRVGLLVVLIVMILVDPLHRLPGFQQFGDWLVQQSGSGAFSGSSLCHLGGAVVGMIVSRRILRPRISLDEIKKNRIRGEQMR